MPRSSVALGLGAAFTQSTKENVPHDLTWGVTSVNETDDKNEAESL